MVQVVVQVVVQVQVVVPVEELELLCLILTSLMLELNIKVLMMVVKLLKKFRWVEKVFQISKKKQEHWSLSMLLDLSK